jgi:hypothetical protein
MVIPDLSWLVGVSLATAEKSDLTWLFSFSGGGKVWTESPWRLVTGSLLLTTSADHGERFGVDGRVDASARLLTALQGKAVVGYAIAPRTADLILEFADNATLEFLCLSSGHPGWRAAWDGHDVQCVGGGHLAVWKHDRAEPARG